ncbi:MAG: hypothetical protein ACK5MV_13420 [Aminipila sp.]
MSENERIITNINATMSMENMPLMEADKERIRGCLEGKVSFQNAIEQLVEKYMNR